MEPDVDTIQALRAKFEVARESAAATEVRAAAVAYYRARAAQGATQREGAGELGLTQWKLSKWNQKKHRAGGASGGDSQQQPPTTIEGIDCAALKQEIERLGPRSTSREIPARSSSNEWRSGARAELARGVGAVAVAERVGVPWESISRWLGHRTAPSGTAPKVRPVRLVRDMPVVMASVPNGPVLRSPSGFIVEGGSTWQRWWRF